MLKRRLDSNGQPLHEEGEAHRVGPELDDKLMHTGQEGDNSTCGSCYGANSSPEACCNNCEEVGKPAPASVSTQHTQLAQNPLLRQADVHQPVYPCAPT